jgi:hypothetical protein
MPIYRGYLITAENNDGRTRIEIHPTRPDLPILRQYWFFVRPFLETYPMDEAKRRVDRVLEDFTSSTFALDAVVFAPSVPIAIEG